ncbi:MAG: KH domain-containing protein [Oscillospiraceae bacterium]|jgi:predicted RNA-binding protein YlqC (UPF0109 family)|nr:KH domain-containing protein [Oscillospiraceae bacterium]
MTELLRYIASSLVDHPEMIEIKETRGADSLILELHVHPDDMGKVIGKQGRIAKSIRSVVKAAAVKNPVPVFVEII